jgi:hypothetical protein
MQEESNLPRCNPPGGCGMTSPHQVNGIGGSEYRKVVLASVFGTIIEWYDF